LSRKQKTFERSLQYGIVVVIGYSADIAFYAFLAHGGANIYLANVISFCFGATVNVFLLRQFVFTSNRFPFLTDVILTLMSNGLMFTFGMGIFSAQIELYDVNHYWAKISSSGVTFLLNYLSRFHFFQNEK
jgi:putative flippase GtrA